MIVGMWNAQESLANRISLCHKSFYNTYKPQPRGTEALKEKKRGGGKAFLPLKQSEENGSMVLYAIFTWTVNMKSVQKKLILHD